MWNLCAVKYSGKLYERSFEIMVKKVMCNLKTNFVFICCTWLINQLKIYILFHPFSIQLIFSFGTSDTVSFLTVNIFCKNEGCLSALYLLTRPRFLLVLPASAIHDEIAGSKDERRRLSIIKVSVWDSPGWRSFVFEKTLQFKRWFIKFSRRSWNIIVLLLFPAAPRCFLYPPKLLCYR